MYSGFDGEQRISFPNSWSDWMQIVWVKSLSSGRLCFLRKRWRGGLGGRKKWEARWFMVLRACFFPSVPVIGNFLGKEGGFFFNLLSIYMFCFFLAVVSILCLREDTAVKSHYKAFQQSYARISSRRVIRPHQPYSRVLSARLCRKQSNWSICSLTHLYQAGNC